MLVPARASASCIPPALPAPGPPANAAPCSANSWRAMMVPRSRTRHWSARLRAAPGGASGGRNGARILPLSIKAWQQVGAGGRWGGAA